ncbi:MAG: hypothetical protein J5883_00975 [Clostridiales bacterium]|nr:hypothetical protein [Clostridiales bacterium]
METHMDGDRHINVNADDLLDAKTTKDDVKKIIRLYRKFFIIFAVMIVLLVFFAILNMNGRGYRAIVLIVVWAVVVADFLRRITVPQITAIKKYKESIEKYGKENIKNEMTSGEQEVYYMFEDRNETYVVVTPSYLVMVNGVVTAWDDIDGIAFAHRHNNYQKNSTINTDDKDIETINNVREMSIKRRDGSEFKTLIALREQDFNEFFMNLCDRFPEKAFSSQ